MAAAAAAASSERCAAAAACAAPGARLSASLGWWLCHSCHSLLMLLGHPHGSKARQGTAREGSDRSRGLDWRRCAAGAGSEHQQSASEQAASGRCQRRAPLCAPAPLPQARSLPRRRAIAPTDALPRPGTPCPKSQPPKADCERKFTRSVGDGERGNGQHRSRARRSREPAGMRRGASRCTHCVAVRAPCTLARRAHGPRRAQ